METKLTTETCVREPDWSAMDMADVLEGVVKGIPGAREEYARRRPE